MILICFMHNLKHASTPTHSGLESELVQVSKVLGRGCLPI